MEPEHFCLNFEETIEFYDSLLTAAAAKGDDAISQCRRELGQTDLFFLIINILKRPDFAHPWLFARCREVQRDPNGFLDLWPRFHYKSTLSSFAFPIFEIINDPNITIGIFAYNATLAKEFLKQIKTEMEQNPSLHSLWPEIFWQDAQKQAQQWSLDGITVQRTANAKEATVEAYGLVKGQPIGRHYKLRIYDDVVTPESVATPEQIHKTTAAAQMSSNLGTLEGGMERWVGTRYHLFDTYRDLMDRGIIKPRVYPATVDGSEYGEPVLMSKEALAEMRLKNGPYGFSSQFLLNPIADKAMGFRREWLVHADVEYHAAIRQLWRFILVDPAGGKDRKRAKGDKKQPDSDYTTMWVIGHGADEKFRVLDIVRDRLSLTGRADTLMALHRQWKPGLVAYEEYGMQSDIEHIKYVQKNDLYEFDITPLGGSMKKELRILRLIPLFENGYQDKSQGGDGQPKSRIILPTNCIKRDYQGHSRDLVKDFIEQEYTAFPVLAHDDMLDALARIVDLQEAGLIQLPKIEAPTGHDHGLRTGLRNMGKTGEDSWLTA